MSLTGWVPRRNERTSCAFEVQELEKAELAEADGNGGAGYRDGGDGGGFFDALIHGWPGIIPILHCRGSELGVVQNLKLGTNPNWG